MRPRDWLVKGLAPLVGGRRWGADCPAGAPVPTTARCAAVDCDSVGLSTLAEGDRGRVTCLEDPGSAEARKLAALGILPGIDLILVQRTPAYVLRTGHTELALDAGLASQVRVRREASSPAPSAGR